MLCLGGVNFLSFSCILGVYAISATFCSLFSQGSLLTFIESPGLVVYLNKHNIDNDVL